MRIVVYSSLAFLLAALLAYVPAGVDPPGQDLPRKVDSPTSQIHQLDRAPSSVKELAQKNTSDDAVAVVGLVVQVEESQVGSKSTHLGVGSIPAVVDQVFEDSAAPRNPWGKAETVPEVLDVAVLESGILSVSVDGSLSEREALEAVEALEGHPNVVAVEPNYVVNLFSELEQQEIDGESIQTSAPWGLDRVDQKELPLDSNYEYHDAGAGVRVYVVDTGVRSSHGEFGGRVTSGYSVISDGRGTDDCNGHGTHVAGTVAGATFGVAKAATIVPVRVLSCYGSGSYSGVLDALEWIKDDAAGYPNRAVVNMSLGGPRSSLVNQAVDNLVDSGVPVVVASGNSASSACNYSPAGAAAAISVNASTRTDDDAYFSNYGSCTDIYAPGMSIESAYHLSDNSTATLSGTSMASPHVAGAVARLLGTGTSGTADFETILQSANRGGIETGLIGDPTSLLYLEPKKLVTGPAPYGVSAVVDGVSIDVSWTAPTETANYQISGYFLRAFSDETSGTVLARCETILTFCSFGPFQPGSSYFFEVQVVYQSGEMATSSPRIQASVDPVSDTLLTYVARLYFDESSSTPLRSCDTESVGCSLEVPKRGKSYFVDVTAVYASGLEAVSAPRVRIQTQLGQFDRGTVEVVGIAGVGQTLSAALKDWTPVPDSAIFDWYRNGALILANSPDYTLVASDFGKSISATALVHLEG